jgi:glycosyltransferase involved in cell wall biosynthesis
MKVAVIHFNLSTESGDPRMALTVARTFKELGNDVVVYTAEFDPACFSDLHAGLEVRVVPPPQPLASVAGASSVFGKVVERMKSRELLNAIARNIFEKLDPDFDIIYCENDYSYKTGAMYKQAHPNAKIIWAMNNPPFYHSKKNNPVFDALSRVVNYSEGLIARKISKDIDWVVAYDNDALIKKTVHSSLAIIPNPMDYDLFESPVKSLDAKGPITLLGVGALSPARRFEDIIAAAALLRKDGYDARVQLICKDYWRDGGYRGEFEKCIADSGIDEFSDAHFEGAKEADYVRMLKAADFFVFPSNVVVIAVSSLEAMAAGVPLIVSRVTSTARFIEENTTAIFVDPLRPEQIAAAAKKLIDNDAARVKMANAAQVFVKEHMSAKAFVERLIALPAKQ